MLTEVDWKNWKEKDLTAYLDMVFHVFGVERLLFCSDWPICNLEGGYDKSVEIMKNYVSKLFPSEQPLFCGENAIRFYNLNL